ncbi:MAG: type II toxin-antitoxin system ParD family antitoxin [Actinomycetota bacterium]|nr:type II toxin-antitoxin system ParD family antitoxin [Actinomycetota bacterium]
MSKQVTVRLPDELVGFIDALVENGRAGSRAAVVTAAVERERRRRVAERDATILAAEGGNDDLDDLAVFAARTPLEDLA